MLGKVLKFLNMTKNKPKNALTLSTPVMFCQSAGTQMEMINLTGWNQLTIFFFT